MSEDQHILLEQKSSSIAHSHLLHTLSADRNHEHLVGLRLCEADHSAVDVLGVLRLLALDQEYALLRMVPMVFQEITDTASLFVVLDIVAYEVKHTLPDRSFASQSYQNRE